MCGIAGELRRGAPPDRAALERMSRVLEPRGPDGDGLWLDGSAGLAHRRLSIIDLSERGAQPMVDEALGLTIVFNGIIYNHRELRRELERRGARVLLARRHRGAAEGLGRVGRGAARPAGGDVRVLPRRARVGARGAGARPARQEAAVPAGAAGRRAAAGVIAAGAGGGGRGGHARRPGGAAPLPVVPLDRAGAADDPARRAQAAAGDGAGGRARRAAARAALLGPAVRARCGARGLVRATTGRTRCCDALRVAVRRRMVSDVPVGILLSGGLDSLADRRAAGRAGADRAGDVLGRLPRRRRPRRRRVRVLRPDRARVRHRPPPDPGRAGAAAAGAAAGDRGDERADGLARRGRVLPALGGGAEGAQGRAVGAGRGRGVRRLLLVSAAAGGRRGRARGVRVELLRPRPRPASPRSSRSPLEDDPSCRFAADWFSRRGRVDRDRPRAAARRRGDARRRPGQARRQHDDGARARGAHAVPRPRAGRARGGVPAGAQARRGRQGRAEAGGARGRARRGDRPAEGLLPRARRCRTSRGRCWSWSADALRSAAARDRGLFREDVVEEMLRSPNEHRTNLDGSTLWQLGLLELWLQTHLS